MGFLTNVRGLFGRPQSLLAAAAVATSTPAPAAPTRAPVEAEGIPGGGNFRGRLTNEPTADLRDTSGYGQAGTYEVGEWAKAALGNPWVTMALDHVLRPVAAARVDVTPAKGINEADAKLHAEFVQWALTESFDLGSLNKAAAQGALLSGFSLFEPVAFQTQHEGASRWALKEVRQCLPNSLDPAGPWQVDETGRLTGIAQQGPVGMSGRWVRSVLPEERALLCSWKREAGNFAGVSQLRSCWYTACRAMPRLLKMVPVTLQREGPGIPVAVSQDKDAKLTPEQRVELIEIFANLPAHESSGLVMPTGWKMDWVVSPATNKGHIVDVIERMGLWVLQQFGAQQLVIGTGTTGALSSSETHDARSMAMVVEVLGFLARVYNGARGEADGLVKRLVDWNFGPQLAYPKLKLTAQRSELGPKEMAEAAKTAKDAGLLTPTIDDENLVREKLSLPPITEEQRKEAKEAAAALAPQLQPGAESDEEDAPGEGKPFGKKPPTLSASAPRVWQPWRALRASEQRVKFAAIDAFFAERREEFERRVRPLVVLMLSKAAPALDAAMADGVIDPQEIAAVPLALGPLRKALKKYTAEVRAAGAEFVRGEMQRPLLAAADGDDRDVELSKSDKVIEATEELLASRIENRLRSELAREAVDTMRTGGDANEVWTRAVQRQIDTGAFKADAGTITAKVFSVGREEAAELMGGVASVEYSSLLDAATCDACRSLDGRTAAFNSSEHDAMLPPNRDCAGGDNCRCLIVFIPGGAS